MDGTHKSSHVVDRTGQQWGHYRIISSLEQGRFSRAYLGEHLASSKQYVIDILPMPLAREQVDVFLRQARTLTQLVHQHILRLVDIGVENFTPFIVFDYVSHIPLRQLYQKGDGQPLDKVLPYLKQAVSALQFAHEKGVLHKNLRPENVLLGWSSGTLLCDFAIDVIADNEQYLNYQRSKDPVDAMAYMAPELVQRQASKASDQYALAIMTYEWLCGSTPFQGSYFDIARQHMHSDPPRLRTKAPAVSREVEEVVMTALSKDPQRRFGNVAAFIKALEQAHNPAAVVPTSPTPPRSAVQEQRSPLPQPVGQPSAPAPVTLSAAVPVPAAPTLSPPAMQSSNQPPMMSAQPGFAPPQTPMPQGYDPLLAAAMEPTPGSLSSSPSSAPAQRRQEGHSTRRAFFIAVAGVATLGGGGAWFLWQRLQPSGPSKPGQTTNPTTSTPGENPEEGGPKLTYSEHTARINAVTWSPDGKRIVSAGDSKLALICDATDGKTLQRYEGHKDRINAVAWSPNGKWVASASADKTVHVWEAESGKLIRKYEGHKGAVNCVTWSPDSRIIASGSDDRTVHAWFPANGNVFLFYEEHTGPISAVAWSPEGGTIASASWDTTVHVFSTEAIPRKNIVVGDTIFPYEGHQKEVYALAWSPDGTILASAGEGNVVQLCNGTNGAAIIVGKNEIKPRPHRASVRSISWFANGQFLAASDDNKEVRVWDVKTPVPDRPLHAFKGHTDAVLAVGWAPGESKLIASAGADKALLVWEARV